MIFRILTTSYDAAMRRINNHKTVWRSLLRDHPAPQDQPRMSKVPTNHASLKIKRKRAHVWPFATRSMCEKVIGLLSKAAELVRELSSPEEWKIHPTTEVKGKGFHHERRLWVRNDLNT